MVKILDFFPWMRMNFNLVPSLLMQIEQYVNKDVTDTYLEYTLREAGELSEKDKLFILRNFFNCNWDRMVHPYPRYQELLNKRGTIVSQRDIENSLQFFSDQDMLDLQMWFNLAWFGAYTRQYDSVIKELIQKGKNYTEADKRAMVAKQYEVMEQIIPKYKELCDKGQIELSTTPFYHPILPLICNSAVAAQSDPGIQLPELFKHPEDASRQLDMALEFFFERFGRMPEGIWPAEGAVSDEALNIIASRGINWTATDQDILRRTAQSQHMDCELDCQYHAVRYESTGHPLHILFRDKKISDQIGFTYKNWATDDAVRHCIESMEKIVDLCEERVDMPVIPIVLDGENAWEHYANNGWDFLTKLYEALVNNYRLQPITISEYLRGNCHDSKSITNIHPGSWIDANFNIWIGHEEDNKAWMLIRKARHDLVNWQQGRPKLTAGEEMRLDLAWQEIFIAQGSDWNWWYGDDYSSMNDKEFDELFRQHLMNIYEIVGIAPPKELFVPIKSISRARPLKNITGVIKPTLDGRITDFYEWENAGYYDTEKIIEAGYGKRIVDRFYYGYDTQNMYLRIDFTDLIKDQKLRDELYISIKFINPSQRKLILALQLEAGNVVLLAKEGTRFDMVDSSRVHYKINRICEIQIPFEELALTHLQRCVQFLISVERMGREVERWPVGNIIEFIVPSQSDMLDDWIV